MALTLRDEKKNFLCFVYLDMLHLPKLRWHVDTVLCMRFRSIDYVVQISTNVSIINIYMFMFVCGHRVYVIQDYAKQRKFTASIVWSYPVSYLEWTLKDAYGQTHPTICCMKYLLKIFSLPAGKFSPDLSWEIFSR